MHINVQPLPSENNNMGAHTLSIGDFMESPNEKSERESALHKLFNIMMSTYSLSTLPSNESTRTIKEFKEIFAMNSEMNDLLPAEIYYMELLDENPYSLKMLLHLIKTTLSFW
jgi:hypothetical protein